MDPSLPTGPHGATAQVQNPQQTGRGEGKDVGRSVQSVGCKQEPTAFTGEGAIRGGLLLLYSCNFWIPCDRSHKWNPASK